MNEEKLLKYLEFLKTECQRYSTDDYANENEINLFQLEVNKFKTTLKASFIEKKVKEKVCEIDFKLIPKPKNTFLNILSFLISWEYYSYQKRQENLAKKFKQIAVEIENTIFDLKAFN
ncbi:MAG: hypothetical protein JXR05_01530 [Flavobacteriaceae bacterium]